MSTDSNTSKIDVFAYGFVVGGILTSFYYIFQIHSQQKEERVKMNESRKANKIMFLERAETFHDLNEIKKK